MSWHISRTRQLEKRSLDYTLSGKVRNQDSPAMLEHPVPQPRYARSCLAIHSAELGQGDCAADANGARPTLSASTGSFCSTESRDQVSAFFSVHKVRLAERSYKRAIDQINDCIEFRANQESNLKAWLAAQK